MQVLCIQNLWSSRTRRSKSIPRSAAEALSVHQSAHRIVLRTRRAPRRPRRRPRPETTLGRPAASRPSLGIRRASRRGTGGHGGGGSRGVGWSTRRPLSPGVGRGCLRAALAHSPAPRRQRIRSGRRPVGRLRKGLSGEHARTRRPRARPSNSAAKGRISEARLASRRRDHKKKTAPHRGSGGRAGLRGAAGSYCDGRAKVSIDAIPGTCEWAPAIAIQDRKIINLSCFRTETMTGGISGDIRRIDAH